MKALFHLEIPRRAATCTQGQEPLKPGMDYYSVVSQEGDKKFSRQDFCAPCWELSAQEESIQNQRSYWKSTVSLKKEEKNTPLNRDERVLELLKASLSTKEEETAAECFVLALYLARRKIIFLRQELKQENGECVQVYEIAATEEMLALKKIDLSQFSIQNIQRLIAEKLKNG